jgi:hypothetical protein
MANRLFVCTAMCLQFTSPQHVHMCQHGRAVGVTSRQQVVMLFGLLLRP